MRSATTAVATRSPRYLGKMTPRDTAPTWWPARPTRWRPLATDGGASTCTTRSTAPMSMPSSRLLVATTHGSRPDFRSSSIMARCSLLTEPWWARARRSGAPLLAPDWAMISAGGSPSPSASPWVRSYEISLRRAVRRSASRRELANTSVDRWCLRRGRRRVPPRAARWRSGVRDRRPRRTAPRRPWRSGRHRRRHRPRGRRPGRGRRGPPRVRRPGGRTPWRTEG